MGDESMYYVLECFGPEEEDRAAIGEILNTEVAWQSGVRFEASPPIPVDVLLDADFPGILMPMFNSGILLLSGAMVKALTVAGVDNIDYYDAVIHDPVTRAVCGDYKAANIIGLVAAANLARSSYRSHSEVALIDADFDSLIIDESKATGLLMFRLAECVTAIVIHERVKAGLERSGIGYLDFTRPEDWVG